jgi:acetyl/propionyl-CoA carboxylase alpha subunit
MTDKGLKLPASGRIGIINRGEAALRFIRGLREWNSREGASLETVTLYLDSEKDALFVQESNYSFPLSAFPEFSRSTGSAYLNRALMLQALTASDCVAVWVGWGFLSEDAEFVAMIEQAGLVFLGPDSTAMALLGDKIAAKQLAEKTDVPIVPWSQGPVRDLAEASRVATSIGYPCIVKAANAGGGRGIRFVLSPADLPVQFKSAVEETLRVTGNTVVFIERLVEPPSRSSGAGGPARHGQDLRRARLFDPAQKPEDN